MRQPDGGSTDARRVLFVTEGRDAKTIKELAAMTNEFKSCAKEADVLHIGDLGIENWFDRVALTGNLALTKDKVGLTLAKDLHSLIGRVVKVLVAQKQLP